MLADADSAGVLANAVQAETRKEWFNGKNNSGQEEMRRMRNLRAGLPSADIQNVWRQVRSAERQGKGLPGMQSL